MAKVPQTERSDSNYAFATDYVATELEKKKKAREAKETKKGKVTEKQGEVGEHDQGGEQEKIRGTQRGTSEGNPQRETGGHDLELEK